MPMVETSVAVAAPSTTAVRMTNGSSSAGRAQSRLMKIALPMGRGSVLLGERRVSTNTSTHSMAPSNTTNNRPTKNKPTNNNPNTKPTKKKNKQNGTVSV